MSIAAPATNPASDLSLKLPATVGSANQLLKNSGTAGTLEFASNVTVDSNGRLLVGTTSPGESNGDEATFYNNGNAGITIRSAADADCKIYFSEGTSGGSQYRGAINYDHDTHYMSFSANENERIRILGTGGITFNGDTAAANAIDDYEEGTWTPTIVNATIGTQRSAQYTKIGNIVYIQGYFETASGSGGSAISMGGLPYTVSSTTNYASYACGRIGSGGHTNSASDIVFQFQTASTTFVPLVQDGNINEGMASSVHMIFSGFYHV